MLNDIPEHVKRRNRQRSIAMSDNLIEDIRRTVRDHISLSSFVRVAILNELEKYKKQAKNKIKN